MYAAHNHRNVAGLQQVGALERVVSANQNHLQFPGIAKTHRRLNVRDIPSLDRHGHHALEHRKQRFPSHVDRMTARLGIARPVIRLRTFQDLLQRRDLTLPLFQLTA